MRALRQWITLGVNNFPKRSEIRRSICVSIRMMSTCVLSVCVMSIRVSVCVMAICVMSSWVMSSCLMSICAKASCLMLASPRGTATRNAIYTQQAAKSACREDVGAHFRISAQLPGTQFIHSKAPNPHASKTSAPTYSVFAWDSYPEHNLCRARRQTHMPGRRQRQMFASPHGTVTRTQKSLSAARRQTRMPGRRQRAIFPSLRGAATPNAIGAQKAAKPACQEDVNTKFLHFRVGQQPSTQFTHSKVPNLHARKDQEGFVQEKHVPTKVRDASSMTRLFSRNTIHPEDAF